VQKAVFHSSPAAKLNDDMLLKIDFGVYLCFRGASKRSEMSGSGYQTFWRFVEASKIDAKPREPSFFQMKRTELRVGSGGTNEPCSKVLVNELTQSGKFFL